MIENNREQLLAAQVFFFFASATTSEFQSYILLSNEIIAHLKWGKLHNLETKKTKCGFAIQKH